MWYWTQPAGMSVFADGMGDSGNPKTVCVGFHSAAGSDAADTPSARATTTSTRRCKIRRAP